MMVPREHGAYGELAFPLAAAVLVGEPNPVALGLVAAAILLFLAHEPLLVARGLRGRARQTEKGQTAIDQFLAFGFVALTVGGSALWAADATVRLLCLVPLGLGALAFAVASTGNEQTGYGQLLASAALVSPSLPVAAAAGRATGEAALLCSVWFVSFALFTAVVRAVARQKKDHGRARKAAGLGFALTVAALGAMSLVDALPGWPLLAATPSLAAALVLLLWLPSPRHLHRIGWSLVGSSVATFFAVVLFMP
jgi:hypothetical protein